MRVQVRNLDGDARGSIVISSEERYLLTQGVDCLGNSIPVLAVSQWQLDLFRVTPEQYEAMTLEEALPNHDLGYHESSLLRAIQQ